MKKIYLEPEAEVINLTFAGCVLLSNKTGSTTDLNIRDEEDIDWEY